MQYIVIGVSSLVSTTPTAVFRVAREEPELSMLTSTRTTYIAGRGQVLPVPPLGYILFRLCIRSVACSAFDVLMPGGGQDGRWYVLRSKLIMP